MDNSVGLGQDFLRGVNRAHDLVAFGHARAVADEHVHGGVDDVLVAARPLDGEGEL